MDKRKLALETLHGLDGGAVVPFDERPQCLEFVDEVTLLGGVCRCGGRAPTGKRLLDAENFALHASPPRIPNAVILCQRRLTLSCGGKRTKH
ncbi:MAG TPA: hypothetical protein VII80_07615 [Pseudolabrys sp.]